MPVVLLPGHPGYHTSRKFRIVPTKIVIKCGDDIYTRVVRLRRPDPSGAVKRVHPATIKALARRVSCGVSWVSPSTKRARALEALRDKEARERWQRIKEAQRRADIETNRRRDAEVKAFEKRERLLVEDTASVA